jgi:insertion element IS1 protein InsB
MENVVRLLSFGIPYVSNRSPNSIMLVKLQQCPACQSIQIVKNGHTRHGNQRVKCHNCGKTRVLMPKKQPLDLAMMERACRERLSLRGIARVFKVSLQTVLLVVKLASQELPAFRESTLTAHKEDVIEFDEVCRAAGAVLRR